MPAPLPDALGPLGTGLLAALGGLLVGHLLGLVALRLPRRLTWDLENDVALASAELGREVPPPEGARPGLLSAGPDCPACHAPLSRMGGVPVLGFLALRGRCSACGAALSLDAPVVELATAGAFAVLVLRLGATPVCLAACALVAWLVALAAVDARERILPDVLTLPGLWLGLLVNAFGLFVDPASAILGAAGGFAFIAGSQRLFERVTGREGMGGGDHKLFALIGAWLGWQVLPAVLLLALGAAAAGLGVRWAVQRGAGHGVRSEVAFGPYLAAAATALVLGAGQFLGPLLL